MILFTKKAKFVGRILAFFKLLCVKFVCRILAYVKFLLKKRVKNLCVEFRKIFAQKMSKKIVCRIFAQKTCKKL